jgi:pimeloyl-ACP methyl ester carboxylesterase
VASVQRKTFPDARIEMLADSGHFPFSDNPERVTELITGFLRDQAEP